jgi:hypothetical protein
MWNLGFGVSLMFFLLPGCGDAPVKKESEGDWSNAANIGLTEINPSQAPFVSQADVGRLAAEVEWPGEFEFMQRSGLSLSFYPIVEHLNMSLSFDSSSYFNECVAEVLPELDVIAAKGDQVEQQFFANWSDCFKAVHEEAGVDVQSAKCDMSGVTAFQCPEMDYSLADGRSYEEARSVLGDGLSGCRPREGEIGFFALKAHTQCHVTGTLNGKDFVTKIEQKYVSLSPEDGPCEFTSRGGKMMIGKCFNGGAKNILMQGNGTSALTEMIYRFNLKGSHMSRTGVRSTAPVRFELNDWIGHVTTKPSSVDYKLARGSKTVEGSL